MIKLFKTKDEYTNGFYDAVMIYGSIMAACGLIWKGIVWAIDKLVNK